MENGPKTSIAQHFSSLKDPRIRLKIRHKLIDIIIITYAPSYVAPTTGAMSPIMEEPKKTGAKAFWTCPVANPYTTPSVGSFPFCVRSNSRNASSFGDKITQETRYLISCHPNDAKRFAKVVRDHWTIENQLHWVFDIAFREDESRVRDRSAATNLNILRRLAVTLCRAEKTPKVGIKVKRKPAGWNDDYFLTLLRLT